MSAEICAADTPMTAGPIATSTRRTPSSRQSKRGRPSIPIFMSGRTCSASCAAPPMKTPHARALIGRVAIRREKHRGADDRDVEQDRRDGGNGELPVDVEHAARERHERHEEEVREHDPDHFRRQLDLAGRAREAGGERVDEPRRGENADERQAAAARPRAASRRGPRARASRRRRGAAGIRRISGRRLARTRLRQTTAAGCSAAGKPPRTRPSASRRRTPPP